MGRAEGGRAEEIDNDEDSESGNLIGIKIERNRRKMNEDFLSVNCCLIRIKSFCDILEKYIEILTPSTGSRLDTSFAEN